MYDRFIIIFSCTFAFVNIYLFLVFSTLQIWYKSLYSCYDMEQGSTLHDSNQNTLISVLINNLVPQTDYSTSIKFDSVTNSENIHVTADANDNPIQDQDIIEVCKLLLGLNL